MALILIGTGISFDLTLSAIEELKKCDEVYVEQYTNVIENEKINKLERLINKKIKILGRSEVESKFLIERAGKAKNDVALLASGDPLTATTHIALIIDAKKAGVAVRVIHNSSIYTAAAGKAGLQIYRFGKTATIPNPRPNYAPTSWFDIIKENLSGNAHTLVLLDTEPEPMEAKNAIELIEANDKKEKTIGKTKIIVLSRIGEKDEKIVSGNIEELKKTDLGTPPFAVIVPAKLHVVEEEYLAAL